MLKCSPTFFNIFKAFSSPIPVKESKRERLALRYEPLNMKGILSLSVTSLIFSAILIGSSILSIEIVTRAV